MWYLREDLSSSNDSPVFCCFLRNQEGPPKLQELMLGRRHLVQQVLCYLEHELARVRFHHEVPPLRLVFEPLADSDLK